jgi:transposase-like protein
VHRYSKHDLTGVGLDRLAELLGRNEARQQSTSPLRQRYKLQQRTGLAELTVQLVVDYQAGVSTTDLTRRYNLGKSSVLRLLHDAGVAMRNRPLSEAQIAQAIRLYEAGMSTSRIASGLALNQSTVWRTLKARGVAMRPRPGDSERVDS